MKKFISTVTAMSMLFASTAMSSAYAGGLDLFKGLKDYKIAVIDETPTPAQAATAEPTVAATAAPTPAATEKPTAAPTAVPTVTPTAAPTETPTSTPVPIKITGISLNKQNLSLKIGESFTLVASIEPENAVAEKISWVSSDKCVEVDNGKVTAVSAGTAVVNAVTEDSKYVASCYVSVVDESGTLALHVSEGVKEVVVTKDGLSKEINAGITKLEAGTYKVSAEAEADYKLMEYADSVTIRVGEKTEIAVAAEREKCHVYLPEVAGCTITPVNGSENIVGVHGNYSFKLALNEDYNSKNLAVKANGVVITPVDDVYTVSDITTDITITIDGVTAKSSDTSLKYVKVLTHTAVLGENDVYTVVIPYGEHVTITSIDIMPNDLKSEYSVTTIEGKYKITVKAEDGTTKDYTLVITNLEVNELDELKLAIEGLTFEDVNQTSNGSYKTQDEIKSDVTKLLETVAAQRSGVTISVENGEAKAPVKGTASNPDGENGYYKYAIKISDGTSERNINIEITIYSYKYVISPSKITSTATTVVVQDLDDELEIALFTMRGGRLRKWTEPESGKVVFKNLEHDTTYIVKVRAAGSDETPTTGTSITTKESAKVSGSRKYYTVTFDEGSHGEIVSGKAKQSVRIARAPIYPKIEADEGYIFKGWSLNGVLVEAPEKVQIRCTSSFVAMYERASGSSYGSSTNKPSNSAPSQGMNPSTADVFYDVPSNSWYYNSVKKMTENGYMNGTETGKFEPNSTLTRAMLVTILYRYACEPEADKISFADVASNAWYADAVAWAADAGIVEGTAPGRFEPEANITREQLATIMYRYCEAFGYDTSETGNIIKYKDSHAISDWAQTALIWTTGAGIIDGKDNNMLDPGGNATRAEAAAIIERFDNFINE